MQQKKGPLAGLRVLDFGRHVACPTCGMLLGDMGAEVIKIEKAPLGDDTRYNGRHKNGQSLYYPTQNRNKKSITVNFRSAEGQKLLRELIAKSDILIENFRPGTMAKMGLSYDEVKKINPGIIMASISGFGQENSMRDRPSFDSTICAISGIMDINSGPEGPRGNGLAQMDIFSGTMALVSILAALHYREKTGIGQFVDTAMFDTALFCLNTFVPYYDQTGEIERNSVKNYYSCPAGRYKSKDGYVFVIAGGDGLYNRVLTITDDPVLNDERYNTLQKRLIPENYKAVNEAFENMISTKTSAEWDEIFERIGVPCAIINDISQVVKIPVAWERNALVKLDVPDVGPVAFPGCPIHLSETPIEEFKPAPKLGEHNEEIYSQLLGYSAEEIAHLKEIKAI